MLVKRIVAMEGDRVITKPPYPVSEGGYTAGTCVGGGGGGEES